MAEHKDDGTEMQNWNLLPSCGKEAENLDIIRACDRAASVGQVGHQVAVDLTRGGNAPASSTFPLRSVSRRFGK